MVYQLLLFLLVLHSSHSQFCGNVDIGSKLVNSAIFVVNSSTGQFSLIDVAASGSQYKVQEGAMGLLPTNSDSTCPRSCLYEILSYMSPRNDSVLHVRGHPYPLIVPPGYRKLSERQVLSCAQRLNDCGATVPIYRHYKLPVTAHAYSFTPTVIPGYVREFMPICYGWSEIKAGITRITTSAVVTRVPILPG